MASSSTSSCNTYNDGTQEYAYPSHVNAASFLSIKLSGKKNFVPWGEQMTCLLECYDMLGFLHGNLINPQENGDYRMKTDKTDMEKKYREWKRSDTLVKGWIFGSLTEGVMGIVVGLQTANHVWIELNKSYSPTATTTPLISTISNKDQAEYIPLYRAILRGQWEKAQEIFNKDKDAFTTELNVNGYTALHLAIGTCDNIYFVENLLNEINAESLSTMITDNQSNALHRAAAVGNTKAAKLLVQKNPHLLFIGDGQKYLPIHRAIFYPHETTFLYLLEVSKQNIRLSQHEGYHSPFEGINGVLLLGHVITAGLLDVAYELIKEYPDMARTMYKDVDAPLACIAGKSDLYYSGALYNSYQRFIYSHVPTENISLGNRNRRRDIENQESYNAKFVTKCKTSFFYPVIWWIYVKFWKVALLHVQHIKHLQEDKVKHNKALMLLKCICEEVGKLNRLSDISEHYGQAFTLALEHDTSEAIEVITEFFPQAIWTKNNGYYPTQFVIVNRCEKVYNFLVHRVTDNKQLHKVSVDKDENNLLHLAGRLAPIEKLNLVSGAALQMQRDLQWFREVEKFLVPKHKKAKNKKQETPIMVFRREHKELRKEGEEWLKKTADSYTITAALIITIVFAAAITVPGGNDGNTGKAIYATKPSFIIFAVSDAISLFTSTTSLLLFLSILTTRYREEDFLYKLPTRLMVGLAMLFLSVTSMMVAFSATLYIMSGQEKAWILIPIAALTCLPIASFVTLQLPLLVDLFSSTYANGIFGEESAVGSTNITKEHTC